jgi:hypothetical protein
VRTHRVLCTALSAPIEISSPTTSRRPAQTRLWTGGSAPLSKLRPEPSSASDPRCRSATQPELRRGTFDPRWFTQLGPTRSSLSTAGRSHSATHTRLAGLRQWVVRDSLVSELVSGAQGRPRDVRALTLLAAPRVGLAKRAQRCGWRKDRLMLIGKFDAGLEFGEGGAGRLVQGLSVPFAWSITDDSSRWQAMRAGGHGGPTKHFGRKGHLAGICGPSEACPTGMGRATVPAHRLIPSGIRGIAARRCAASLTIHCPI